MQLVTNESEISLNDSKFVAIKFFASWCGPCKVMDPSLKKLETEFSDVKFLAVDIDELPAIAAKYKIMSVPTIVLLKSSKEVERVKGMQALPALRNTFAKIASKE